MSVITIGENRKVTIEDAELIWRNFEGAAKPFNDEGDRNFCIVLDDTGAQALGELGYNVKRTKPDETSDREPINYIKITVNFNGKPPQVTSVTNEGRTRTMITKDTAELVDGMDIVTSDVVFGPYDWEVGGKTGTSAYLQKMFFVPNEDDLDRKWAPPED